MTPQDFIEWEKKAPGIDFKMAYVDVAGDFVAGVLLSQIIFWHLPGEKSATRLRVKLDGSLWIAKTKEQWWAETRMGRRRFDRARHILEKKGLIKVRRKKFKGNPMLHIQLDVEAFLACLDAVLHNPALPGLE